ncbi:hypothetical protein CAL26_08020 [Bordetella genomosp. 9]|uniref:Uncharacterized protein n=1 Tax=Bordetella genomosp. 9 TaxID=1416803 RepID=A0A261RFD6_9BORD|nr:hypothetical protein [Bordetella genomosp. 9]OZI23392.1 hypothetical protein CAL26_08020 [Bordetella genomosp. 9]
MPGIPGSTQSVPLALDALIEQCRRRVARDPRDASAHLDLAEALLLSGRLEEGWPEYEWRFALPGVPPPLPIVAGQPLWDGAPMAHGTLVLVADQGYGDVIQFCRYIPAVMSCCANVTVACSPEMLPIVTQLAAGARCVTRWNEVGDFAAWCPLSGLPMRFRTVLETIPSAAAYLSADPARVAAWRKGLDELIPGRYRRIGLVWAGRPTHRHDARRSLRLEQLAPLANLPDVALVALQLGPAQREIDGYRGMAPLVNAGGALGDFGETMAAIACLDHVVSVDTAPAHLAGALGCPVSLLLAHMPDWRWLSDRRDTPWYPAMSLYRQPAPGRWDPVIAAVARDLAAR